MKKNFKDIALIALGSYALLSMAYILTLVSGITDETVKIVASLFGKQLLFILVYSIVIGVSFLVFGLKSSPIAKRLIHIAVTYGATVAVMLLLVASDTNAAQKLIYVVITTVAFAAVYGLVSLVVYLIKRNKQ